MIRVNRLTDYGVVLLSRFAAEPPETVLSARGLAEETGVPLPTVSKVLKACTRGGLLASHRGTQGGYSLARAPDLVSVADVISCLDGPIGLTDCTTEGDTACDIQVTCPVRTNWQRITDAVREALDAIPLTEMTLTLPLPPAEGDPAPSPSSSTSSRMRHAPEDQG